MHGPRALARVATIDRIGRKKRWHLYGGTHNVITLRVGDGAKKLQEGEKTPGGSVCRTRPCAMSYKIVNCQLSIAVRDLQGSSVSGHDVFARFWRGTATSETRRVARPVFGWC